MKLLKRSFIVVVCLLILIVPVSVNAFAVDPVAFTEAETLGATIIDLYGAVNNTSLAYESIVPSGALTEIVTLYQNYSTSASDPYTLAAIGAAAAAAGAVAVIYDAVTGQGYVQLYQEQYISSLDGYWDYQLADLGFVRDSVTGLFSWTENNGVVSPIVLLSSPAVNGYNLGVMPFQYVDGSDSYTYSLVSGEVYYYFASNNGGTSYQYVLIGDGTYNYLWKEGNRVQMNFNQNMTNGTAYGDVKYKQITTLSSTLAGEPKYIVSNNDSNFWTPSNLFGAPETNAISSIDNLSITPSVYIGDPLQNPLEISVPDVSDPNYAPQPRTITTTIPWNDGWGNPLPDGVSTPEYGVPYPVTDPEILNVVVPAIWDAIVTDGVEIQPDPEPEPDPDPNSVPHPNYNPILPVTLPSFNFSFSGIWHYVRDWVNSLGAWFTLVFTLWASLPYAIIVPVYATAVIVVVLGVYKRFFM